MGDPLTAAPACTGEELHTQLSPVTSITMPSPFFNDSAHLSEKSVFSKRTYYAG
jgi:hypothetical protein